MEPAEQDIVVLHIEGQNLTVNRADLIENSDYFKAMFLGNFAERQKNRIELKDVSLEAMTNLLKMLLGKETVLELEHLLGVLELSCMLQFLEIKIMCVDRLKELLSVSNCLRIWLATERLLLNELISSRAKLMAMLEFYSVKDTQSFLELSVSDLCAYLGSIFLQATSEFDVFEAFMKWCSVNGDFKADDLCKLLDCLNFKKLTDTELEQILQNPHIVPDHKLTGIFQGILREKMGDIEKISQTDLDLCHKLLRSKDRILDGFPCIILDNLGPLVDNNEKAIQSHAVFYYDKFKRKRKYEVLENDGPRSDSSVMSFDPNSKSLRKLSNVESQKFVGLDGFKIVGHRQFFYMLGGEGLLGKGDWNEKFVRYDIINEVWSEKSRFPFHRRHFETCVCGDYLYVIGGTGPFRILQENMFWYSLKEEKWCLKEEKLPCLGRQIKCCCFNGALFILNINSRLGYFYIHKESRWQPITILDPHRQLPNFSQNLSVFGYQGDLYIKDECLMQLTRTAADSFAVAKKVPLKGDPGGAYASESVLCVDTLYTISKRKSDEISEYEISLDAFDMKTYQQVNIFSKSTDDYSFQVEESMFKVPPGLNIFSIFHPLLVADNLLLNERCGDGNYSKIN